MHGTPYGAPKDKPLWHFLEKLYTNEEKLRECASSTLKSVIGGLSNFYFVDNSPCAHIIV
jgi:large subunit ribosomal protein L46